MRCSISEAHKPDVLADGTTAVLLEGLQNPAPGRVGDGVQDEIQFVFCNAHSR